MGENLTVDAERVEARTDAKPLLGYIPQLDGLRALGVLLVLAHHALMPIVNGGFVGVDIFFVISGYLITTLLIREFARRDTIRLKNFYARRVIRLYPAMIIATAVLAIPGVIFASSGWGHVRATFFALTYTTPIAMLFDPNAGGAWTHTWSLGIEEMFYLIWPAILLLCLRARVNRTVMLAGTFVLGAAMLAPWLFTNTPTAGAFLRAGGIFLGCAAAFYFADRKPRYAPTWIAWLALALILWCAFAGGRWVSTGWGIVLVVIATVAMLPSILAGAPTALNRILAARPVTYVGRISYELYLWHYAIFVIGTWAIGPHTTFLDIAWWAVPVSIVAAAATHQLVTPFSARLKKRFAY